MACGWVYLCAIVNWASRRVLSHRVSISMDDSFCVEAWRKACVRAGLPTLRFHDLRHTWASWHAKAGTPMRVLQDLGGWATAQMVERYTHMAVPYTAQWPRRSRPVRQRRDNRWRLAAQMWRQNMKNPLKINGSRRGG